MFAVLLMLCVPGYLCRFDADDVLGKAEQQATYPEEPEVALEMENL